MPLVIRCRECRHDLAQTDPDNDLRERLWQLEAQGAKVIGDVEDPDVVCGSCIEAPA